ncbi:MAG: electron transfer flavoprotein subunit beta/FixA family protein [Acidimicrobiia bacterium]|nr:electron transfer flavoprotein subunit beta/FixA family protein [Acidimicrobiia bacterium]
MKIAVCVKQIPDPAAPYDLDPDSHFVVRPNDQVLDDTDRYGVEVGLQLVEQVGEEATLTLVSMSPAGSLQGIRQALAMGADRAIVIDDETLRGADALTTAKVLAAALQEDGFDLVIAGTESTDGYAGVMPQQLAELLGVPSMSFARKVDRDGDTLRIERQTEDGYAVVEAPFPAVLTVTSGVVEPRYPNFKGIMQAKKKPIETRSCADLGVVPEVQQVIQSVEPIPARQAGEVVEDEGEGYLKIIEKLEEAKVI